MIKFTWERVKGKILSSKVLRFVAAKGLFEDAEGSPLGEERDSFEKSFQRKLSFTLFYKFIKGKKTISFSTQKFHNTHVYVRLL